MPTFRRPVLGDKGPVARHRWSSLGCLLPAGALPSATAATTLQFYGGEAHAVAQIGNTIYVGGSFTSVGYGSGTIARAYLAALDATSGLLVDGFNPRPDNAVDSLLNPSFHPQPNASVLTMALSGRTLYLGGKLSSIAGVTRLRLAAVDAISGGLGTKLTLAPNAAVRDLALNSTADGNESICNAATNR